MRPSFGVDLHGGCVRDGESLSRDTVVEYTLAAAFCKQAHPTLKMGEWRHVH